MEQHLRTEFERPCMFNTQSIFGKLLRTLTFLFKAVAELLKFYISQLDQQNIIWLVKTFWLMCTTVLKAFLIERKSKHFLQHSNIFIMLDVMNFLIILFYDVGSTNAVTRLSLTIKIFQMMTGSINNKYLMLIHLYSLFNDYKPGKA